MSKTDASRPQSEAAVLAVIPAQGGIAGTAGDSLRIVAGRPLLAWVVDACTQASQLTRTIVATNDDAVASVATKHGAEVVWRPIEHDSHLTAPDAWLLRVLEELAVREGYRPAYVAYLSSTSPLTTAEDIDGAIVKARRDAADTVVAVTDFHGLLWKPVTEGSLGGDPHAAVRGSRHQASEPQLRETGSMYVVRTEGFLAARRHVFGKVALWHVPGDRAQDASTPLDAAVCAQLLRARASQRREAMLPAEPAALIFDFDGVFTDNRVWVSQTGEESVACNRSDAFGLAACRALNIPLAVFSTEANPVVAARCAKLQLECVQGLADKGAALGRWLAERGLAPADVVYVGNDVNDLGCFTLVGCPVATGDAHPQAMDAATIVLEERGGFGAVREIAELVARHVRTRRERA